MITLLNALQMSYVNHVPKQRFCDIALNSEFMSNRDGYVVKVSEQHAIIKLYDELDELVLIDDAESVATYISWSVIMREEFVRWWINENSLHLIYLEEGQEVESIILFD